MHITNEQVKDFLMDSGLMSKVNLMSYKDEEDLLDSLIIDGKVSDIESARIKSYILGIPFVELSKDNVSYNDLINIPETISRKHNIVSFGKTEGKLKVAFTDPSSIKEIIENLDVDRIVPYITHSDSIKRSLVEYQKGLQYEFGDKIKKEVFNINENKVSINILDTVLRYSILQNASIIHIDCDSEVTVRYRIKGKLYDSISLPRSVMPSIVERVKKLSGEEELGFKFTTEDDNIFVGTFISDEKVVLKLYSDKDDILLEKLNISKDNIDKIHKNIHSRSGMVIVSGPMGSNRKMLMYSLLDILNSPNSNILTLEKSIERKIPRVNQLKISGEERTDCLRDVSRQDVDVLMIDNVDDSEELSIITNLSLSNHLVIPSVQADSAAECLYKICSVGIDGFLIKNSIKTIIGQKVVKRIGKDSEKYTLSTAGINSLGKIIDMDRMLNILKENKLIKEGDTWKKVPFYRLNKKSNYEGRMGLQEVMIISESIKDLIVAGAGIEKFEEVSRKEGMITLFEDGIMKAVMGQTTLEEVLRVAAN